jgi:hypothetical protein
MTTTATQRPDPVLGPAGENAGGSGRAAGPARAFSPPEVAFLIGVPLLWAVLLLFHPGGEGTELSYSEVQDKVTAWLVVHIGMMLFIPLMAAVVYLLLRGVEGTAARISRIALALFAVFYSAWEALQGIGVGILVDAVNALPQTERATGADLVHDFADNLLIRNFGVFGNIGSLALITAAIAAGVALRRRAGAPPSIPPLLAVSALLITAHPPPYGPAGLALFIVAVLLVVRSRPRTPAPAALGAPRGSIQ